MHRAVVACAHIVPEEDLKGHPRGSQPVAASLEVHDASRRTTRLSLIQGGLPRRPP